ncbi:MAG: phosphate-starvation-inducible PsiE family protein [Burkholderiales bacterium]|jgi:protein PsiE|nr:phosphate-starvation-inducible PsiE family protein [Burkholderiales bacterium]
MQPDSTREVTNIERTFERWSISFGNLLVSIFHRLALFAIGLATVWSAGDAFIAMFQKGFATVGELILLFIYLEIGAMIGVYFKTNRMPVRFLIAVAITAVTRLIIDIVSTNHEANLQVLIMAGAILLLAFSTAMIQFASSKFPDKLDPS